MSSLVCRQCKTLKFTSLAKLSCFGKYGNPDIIRCSLMSTIEWCEACTISFCCKRVVIEEKFSRALSNAFLPSRETSHGNREVAGTGRRIKIGKNCFRYLPRLPSEISCMSVVFYRFADFCEARKLHCFALPTYRGRKLFQMDYILFERAFYFEH